VSCDEPEERTLKRESIEEGRIERIASFSCDDPDELTVQRDIDEGRIEQIEGSIVSLKSKLEGGLVSLKSEITSRHEDILGMLRTLIGNSVLGKDEPEADIGVHILERPPSAPTSVVKKPAPTSVVKKPYFDHNEQPRLGTLARIAYPTADDLDAVELTWPEANCLQAGQWVNDVVIDFYVRYLKHSEEVEKAVFDRFYICSPFLYTKLFPEGNTLDESQIADEIYKWTKGCNMKEKNYILVPINKK
jgi:hypothetical protein